MSAPAPPLDQPAAESPGIWPWVIALFAGGALALAVGERLSYIPRSLESQALERVARVPAPDVAVGVDGRDVTLSGELPDTVDRRALVASVDDIDGVRVVVDELRVVDPVARARDERTRFRDALARIDLGDVAFEPGSASIAPGSEAALDEIARLMRDRPGHRVRVGGHTDSLGRAEVNLALSRERALAVVGDLAARGVERERLIAKGYGATQPVADNDTETGRARNRRIEIVDID